jgi:hypothetical protein
VPTTQERKALNEGRFRQANEELEHRASEILSGDDGLPVPFLCECPDQTCSEVVLLTFAEYEQIRANPEGGLAAPGHEDLSIERVVARNDRYVTTLKGGRAGAVHAEGDART